MVIRQSFPDFYMETMLPAINKVLFDRFKRYPAQYPKIFQVESSGRSIEQFSQVTGVGLAVEIPEAGPIRYDQPIQGFDKTFKHIKHGLSIPISKESVEDDKFNITKRALRELARSIAETREIQAASDFNNAFSGSFTGPDGVALCATNHPIPKGGGVQANRPTAGMDLDIQSLEAGLTDFELLKDSSGKLQRVPARKIVVAPANRWNVHEILKSSLRSDTANNATNAFKFALDGLPEGMVWPYLTDPDAWFIVADPDDTGLVWFDRKKPYTDRDYDKKAEVMYEMMRYRASHGWFDWLGVWGSPGA